MESKAINDAFKQALEKIVGSHYALFREEELEKYAHDEAPGIKPQLPEGCILPANEQELSDVVALCYKHKIPMSPRSGGTGKVGGCVATQGGVVISLERMCKIVSINADDLTVVVEPGVILKDLKDAVAEHGLFYPPDPASLDSCMLGGNVATNASGPSALKYGSTRDFVLGMRVVMPDGRGLQFGKQTVKGVVGYDLSSLICGSEGTLAFISQVTLKLLPRPNFYSTGLLYFRDSTSAAQAVSKLLSSGFLPSTLEYMDETSLVALRKAGHSSIDKHAKAALIIECDGFDEEQTLAQLSKIVDCIGEKNLIYVNVAQDSRGRNKIWKTRHALSESMKRLKGKKVSEDITVPRSQIPKMVEVIRSLGAKYNLLTCSFGHAGDGNLHVQILFSKDEEAKPIDRLLKELFSETVQMGGTISGEHGIGLTKKPFLLLEQSQEVIDLQKSIKAVFDPLNILNPGKIFP